MIHTPCLQHCLPQVPCSSQLTLEQHLIGKRHLRKVQRKTQAELQPVSKGLITAFTCRLCDVSAPSQEVKIK